ncbi:hypothetical protein LCGC14_1862130 [marine sediment metagenome]|uniref:Uncharacterized protein n=1 Tax=marine sediment metagenome TaxID=412755 RepID=A0A0F9GVK8_9ZZZZ
MTYRNRVIAAIVMALLLALILGGPLMRALLKVVIPQDVRVIVTNLAEPFRVEAAFTVALGILLCGITLGILVPSSISMCARALCVIVPAVSGVVAGVAFKALQLRAAAKLSERIPGHPAALFQLSALGMHWVLVPGLVLLAVGYGILAILRKRQRPTEPCT